MSFVRQSVLALLALGAALAAPAFAQDAAMQQGGASTPPAAPQAAAPAAPVAPAAPAAPRQVTWADLDTDKDGDLSKAEVTSVPALAQAFDQADADKNGKLTADEYKAYAASTAPRAASTSGGN